jgi:hypothetical protein
MIACIAFTPNELVKRPMEAPLETTRSYRAAIMQEYFARVQLLTTDVMSAQAAFAGEITQAGYQSLVKLQAVPYRTVPYRTVLGTGVGREGDIGGCW